MNDKYLIVSVIFLCFPLSGLADEYLAGAQIKKLFLNKTYDIKKVNKNSKNHLKSYTGADGLRLVYIPWKSKTSKRKWWIDGNKFCANHPKKEDFCRDIKAIGDGTYHSFTAGVHQSTLSHFQQGNQL